MSTITIIPEDSYFATSSGHQLHYCDHRTADANAPVLLFLHGSGPGASGYSNFKYNYPFFVKHGWRVILVDHLGYGRSDKPDNVAYHLDFFTQAITELMHDLAIRKFAIVGNSLGGAIALKMTLNQPKQVLGLILMAPGGLEEKEAYFEMSGMQAMRDFYMQPEKASAKTLEAVLKALVFDSKHINADLVQERFEVFRQQTPTVISTMQVPNMCAELTAISCPVLSFWGVQDGFIPISGMYQLANACKHSKSVLRASCGHWYMVEYADEFNRDCIDFLTPLL